DQPGVAGGECSAVDVPDLLESLPLATPASKGDRVVEVEQQPLEGRAVLTGYGGADLRHDPLCLRQLALRRSLVATQERQRRQLAVDLGLVRERAARAGNPHRSAEHRLDALAGGDA